ncbi:indolepyruvate oxidoreductase subunit beta family protein [Ramlibacter sp. WS9]|uniref:indolepyruvate oxidoreductase subunit beta family protein n=1 Tax=Ramlibacter sp. WS9 TaxID=1882741 RepID=UPI001142FCD8|nr:indolepyruvate oxidoreductase subunit beta family protein [Ramlibacter sp. WS9]ROZ76243.1 indolepyruvate oxidoreductase subunit beta family protein [Ramlibacter sp. WS9]
MKTARPISLLICALGGEGGGVLTEWIVDAARRAGYPVQATSIPGVAQRTGATTYYVEVFPVPQAELGGRRPVFSLSPVPGALDAMVSSELLETVRQIGNGMSSPDRTLVITSSGRTLTTQERMQLADGRADSGDLLSVVDAYSRAHHVFDMGAVAKEAGTVVSAVMLGALAGSGVFPMAREDYEAVVKESGASAAASLRGFAAAHDFVCHAELDPAPTANPHPVMPDSIRHPSSHADSFPVQVQDMLALGHARMLEYQGPAYAALYLQRLQRVLDAERAADPSAAHNFATTREMARWLALWMAFDDIVRVADLKSRASRWQRVKAEVKAGDDDLLRVYDHFKPGAPEFAALLPASLAARVLRWDRARVIKGKPAWALPLKIGTHSVFGMLALRTLASLKWLRVRGSRYANEQAMIDKWLIGVVDGTQRDWQLGHEIALCGRLIKGYGATNERGKENLLHVLDHLAHGESAAQSAEAIAAAREAALADDAGKAFDSALVQHGAPPRPVKEQPIRFVRKPKTSAAAPS